METERRVCHDCGVLEGQAHWPTCDMESCPVCGEQLLRCTHGGGCGVTEEELVDLSYVPYIHYPNMCSRCGKIDPEMFHVPDDEWQFYIEIAHRGDVLCRECYDWIKRTIDEADEADGQTGHRLSQ